MGSAPSLTARGVPSPPQTARRKRQHKPGLQGIRQTQRPSQGTHKASSSQDRSRKGKPEPAAPQGRKTRHTGLEAPLSCLASCPVWQNRQGLSVCPFWKVPDNLPPSRLSGRSASSAAAAPSSGSADSGTADLCRAGGCLFCLFVRPATRLVLGAARDCPTWQTGQAGQQARSDRLTPFSQAGRLGPGHPARRPDRTACTDRTPWQERPGRWPHRLRQSWQTDLPDESVRRIGQPDQTDTSARTNLRRQVGKAPGGPQQTLLQTPPERTGQTGPSRPQTSQTWSANRPGCPLTSSLTGQPAHNWPQPTQNGPYGSGPLPLPVPRLCPRSALAASEYCP